MLLILFLLFTVLPATELYLLIQLGGEIGVMETIGIVLITGLLGASLARSQGRQVIGRLEKNVRSGHMPPEDLIQAFLIVFGGVLLVTPGIITDVIGFLMIIPGSRTLFSIWLKKAFKNGVKMGKIQFHTAQYDSHNQGWRPVEPNRPAQDTEPAEVINLDSYRSEDT